MYIATRESGGIIGAVMRREEFTFALENPWNSSTAEEEERAANWGEGDTYCELEDLDREERKRKAAQGETPTQTKKKQKKLEAYGSVGIWGKPGG